MDAIYGDDHPYGGLLWRPVRGGALYYGYGTAESIGELTRDELLSAYGKYYRPNNAALVFVGDITPKEARSAAIKHFGKWEAAEVPKEPVFDAAPAEGLQILLIDKPDAVQSVIVAGNLGMRHSDPDFPAMELIRHVLGGSFQRLDLNLREDKGYTYGTGFSLWDDRTRGPMYVIAPVQTQSTAESIFEIVKELSELVSTRPVTEEELADAKSALVNRYPSTFEAIGSIASGLEQLVLHDLPDDAWPAELASWQAVTADQINTAARNRIDPDNLVIVIVGDLKTMESPVRDLGIGSVTVIAETP